MVIKEILLSIPAVSDHFDRHCQLAKRETNQCPQGAKQPGSVDELVFALYILVIGITNDARK